ncbi:MAG: hypothetical protein IKK00_05920 [Oscillospiraceae bacterium]|nr:hypothetical protein [Oscillospiraceae bacterium]
MAKKDSGNDLYSAGKAVRDFCKEHKGTLSEDEHETLRGLLNRRAEATSEALGVKIHSICEE